MLIRIATALAALHDRLRWRRHAHVEAEALAPAVERALTERVPS